MKKTVSRLIQCLRRTAWTLGKPCLLFLGLFLGTAIAQASTDYAPAIWRPAYSGHWYTSGYGHRFMVQHDMEGYYASCITYLQRSSTMVSVTFCINGKKDNTSDMPAGEITQMVREAYYSWHARCWNQYSHGTEHEGFVSNPAWFTEAMYNTSSLATRHICDKYSLPKDRNHIIGHDQKRIASWVTWMRGQGYSDTFIKCNDHTDPGAYWDWTHYMDLVKGTVSTPSAPSTLTVTAASSTQINLVWADNSGIESGYKIERSTDGSSFTQVATVAANVETYSSTGLSPNTLYYYRVRAYNGAGNSAYSNTASTRTKDVAPAAPTGLTATTASSSQINLAWTDASSNETGFKVERSTDNVTFTQVGTTGANVATYADTGLTGNTTYYYRVRSYNAIGNSAYTAVASDITAPPAPSALVATAVSYSQIDLSWTDNSSSEAGFKIERSADNVTFSQIATNAAGVTTYSDTGRSANTTYYYRVRSYNANGNSTYSAVASTKTPVMPPVLAAIGNQTVTVGNSLTFTSTSTDPNRSVTTNIWQTFESFTNNTPNEQVMFNKPANSATTTAFIDTAVTNYTTVTTSYPAGHTSSKVMKVGWTFKTGTTNAWCRLNTYNPPLARNPVMDAGQALLFDIYATKALKVGVGVRETGTTNAYGADGGTSGSIEWAGVTNVVSGSPLAKRTLTASNWTTLNFNIPFEPQADFTGNGVIDPVKAVLEHLALCANGNSGAVTVYLDNFAVLTTNTLTYSLDAGAPAGAKINAKTGVFQWTPTAGQVGNFNITVRVTDQLGATDFETIRVNVVSAGNTPPVLALVGNKTVNELSALSFTASATDVDAGQSLTYSLDAGAPAGATINASTGAFTWTPTEAQGPGSYPITIRVSDNGSPATNDWETITVTVNEINAAPSLATISDQSVDELSTLACTASATDPDAPAQTLTYSLQPGSPAGLSIDPATGAISWTPTEAQGPGVYPVTVRATDSGSPALYSQKSFNVTVNEANVAPVLTVNSTLTTTTNFANFEKNSDGTYSGTVLFHQPSYSSTTSSFLDTSNNITSVEATFPAGNISSRVLWANMSFKSGTTSPWVRLSTYNASTLPNPTIDLTQRVKFDVYTDKAIKIALGIRETGTAAAIGANGGTSGALEWVGSTGAVGTGPNATHSVAAGAGTTLEFNIPAESISAFPGVGNGTINGTKGVLEHLAIVPNGGMGPYNLYFDNFQVVTVSTNPTVDTLQTVTVTCSATDADAPAQVLTYSLDAGAPAGALIDPETGVFTWTPTAAQSPSTNVITVRVTDDGPGALSDAKPMTVIVRKVNTAPRIGGFPDQAVEINSGETISLQGSAEDDDVPADTLTFSLQGTVPTGAAIAPDTGLFTWTPPAGTCSTNLITVRVTDNGVPALYDEQVLTIVVSPTNAPPVLNLAAATVTEDVVNYESQTDYGNERVMFNKPSNSSTTSAFIDTAAANWAGITNSFPAGNPGGGSKVMKVQWSFKTGTTNPWVRLNTYLTGTPVYIPNPTIELGQKLQFDIYTTKSIKLGLGVRETATTAAIGANGGSSGNIEFVGVTNYSSGTPFPSRVIAASNWTTVTFDFPTEPVRGFTGNGVLASGRGTLEELVLFGNAGSGAYTVYVDNFKQIYTYPVGTPVTMNTGAKLAMNPTATDNDLAIENPLEFGLDADAPTNVVINMSTGAITWTPDATFAGTTNDITVFVQDSPTNGAAMKMDSKTFTVTVNADPLGVQSFAEASTVQAGESVKLEWDAAIGQTYAVQYKSGEEWVDYAIVVADAATASVVVTNAEERSYRILAIDSSVAPQ